MLGESSTNHINRNVTHVRGEIVRSKNVGKPNRPIFAILADHLRRNGSHQQRFSGWLRDAGLLSCNKRSINFDCWRFGKSMTMYRFFRQGKRKNNRIARLLRGKIGDGPRRFRLPRDWNARCRASRQQECKYACRGNLCKRNSSHPRDRLLRVWRHYFFSRTYRM